MMHTGDTHPNVSRRGTVYVLVLGISIAVLTIGAGSIAVVRANARANEDQSDASEARSYALSSLEMGRLLIANDPGWRTNRSNGVWIKGQSIGSGNFSLDVTNPLGALNRSDFDPVVLTATGNIRNATQIVQTTLTPVAQPMTCLQAALFSNLATTFNSATVQGSVLIGSNSTVTAVTSLVLGKVEAVGAITGGNYTNTTTTAVPVRTLPDATVFTNYTSIGTTIGITSLTLSSGKRYLDRRLLSPSSNPFGATNAQGIYVIDCLGSVIVIQNSRIAGTLVVLNPGVGSIVQGAMVWSPATPNYPSLLVQGNMTISATGTLSENGSPSINFNPATTPYRGVSNSNTTDTYATALDGLFYVSGNLTIGGNPVINGVVVSGGTLTTSATIVLTYSNTFATNPPPGFGLPAKMLPTPGSWMQTTN